MAQHNISINDSTGANYDLNITFWIFKFEEYNPKSVFVWVLSVIEIPIMFLTLIALFSLIKSRPAASVFVSHLILSDLIQVICMLLETTTETYEARSAYEYSLIVGLYFMVCVSFERYLLVSHPIWYKSHHSPKLSCFISLIVWLVPLIFAEIYPPRIYFDNLPRCIACLIPFPIIIFCFAGTCRGLSHSISLTSLKRKLILGSLFLVLLTYTFLILPSVILFFVLSSLNNNYTYDFWKESYYDLLLEKSYRYSLLLLYVNPLADCLLYMFMRPDVGDLMKSVHCFYRHQSSKHNQDEHTVINPQNSCTNLVCCISEQKPATHSLNTCSSV